MREALESLSEQPQALTPSQVMGHRSHEADSIHPADLADHLENLSPEERRGRGKPSGRGRDAADAIAETCLGGSCGG